MKKITNFNALLQSINEDLHFKPMSVSLKTAKEFGELTGDLYDHNLVPTHHYSKPILQGSFAEALFTKFHKKVCSIKNTEPIKMKIIQSKLPRAVYIGEKFIPIIALESAKKTSDHIIAVWKYTLRSYSTNKPLICYSLEWWYRFKH